MTSLSPQAPEPGNEYVLIWKHPEDGGLHMKTASLEDLLILKMLFEDIDRREVARIGALPIFAVDAAMDRAVDRGIIIAPPSRIRRDFDIHRSIALHEQTFSHIAVFILQWHITQDCDLHCRHCYDRSDRSALTFEQALKIIDDLDSLLPGAPCEGPYFVYRRESPSSSGISMLFTELPLIVVLPCPS